MHYFIKWICAFACLTLGGCETISGTAETVAVATQHTGEALGLLALTERGCTNDPPRGLSTGVLLWRPSTSAAYTMSRLRAEGDEERVAFRFEDNRIRFAITDDIGLLASDDARGTRLGLVPGALPPARGYRLTFPLDDSPHVGIGFEGEMVPLADLPEVGKNVLHGGVRLSATSFGADGSPTTTDLVGKAKVTLNFASDTADLAISDLSVSNPGEPEPKITGLTWRSIGKCGAEIGSNGRGVFRIAGAGNRVINFAGPSADGPEGTAMLSGRFFGDPRAPQTLMGAILIQGNNGVIAGVFSARRSQPMAEPRTDVSTAIPQ